MQAIWAIPISGAASDGGASSLAEVRKMRDEWDEHQQEIERLQEECQARRTVPEAPLVRADVFEHLQEAAYDDSPWTDEEKTLVANESGHDLGWDEMAEYDSDGEAQP